jgi:hypothetical protein
MMPTPLYQKIFIEAASGNKCCQFMMPKMVRSVTLFLDIEIEHEISVSYNISKTCSN